MQDADVDPVCLMQAELRGATLPDGSYYQPPVATQTVEETGQEAKKQTASTETIGIEQLSPAQLEAESALIWAAIEESELAKIAQSRKPVFDTNNSRWILGMLCLLLGFSFFGVALKEEETPLFIWLAVWSSVFIGEGKPESVWTVPVIAAAITTLFKTLSVWHLILSGIIIIMVTSSILFYGSIVSSTFKKTLQEGILLCAFCFVALNISFVIVLGVVASALGLLFLLCDSTELMMLRVPTKKKEDPFIRKRRLIDRKRFLCQFGVAASLGLVLSLIVV